MLAFSGPSQVYWNYYLCSFIRKREKKSLIERINNCCKNNQRIFTLCVKISWFMRLGNTVVENLIPMYRSFYLVTCSATCILGMYIGRFFIHLEIWWSRFCQSKQGKWKKSSYSYVDVAMWYCLSECDFIPTNIVAGKYSSNNNPWITIVECLSLED